MEGTKKFWFAVLTNIVLGSMAMAYHNTVLNNLQEIVKKFLRTSLHRHYGVDLRDTPIETVYSFAVVSIWSLGAIIGTLCAHPLTERFGRKFTLMILCHIIALFAGGFVLIAQATGTCGKLFKLYK